MLCKLVKLIKIKLKKFVNFQTIILITLYCRQLRFFKKIQLKKIIKLFKKYWFKKMGIHAHIIYH